MAPILGTNFFPWAVRRRLAESSNLMTSKAVVAWPAGGQNGAGKAAAGASKAAHYLTVVAVWASNYIKKNIHI